MREFAGTDRFTVERLIGQGGMGMVYQVFDREKNVSVALKTLRVPSADAIFRLKREFRALQDIHHPNLVSLGELCEQDGTWFFTMELVQGTRFIEYLRQSRPERPSGAGYLPTLTPSLVSLPATGSTADAPAQALFGATALGASPHYDQQQLRDALSQLSRGLVALHGAGKIHRDVKPSNILVTRLGRVVLLDFGLVADADDSLASTVGKVVGTAQYMAPEQALGQPVGPEADWYSVGVVLYEALVGAPPFQGASMQVLMDKQALAPVRPGARVKGVPADLEQLCLELLHFEPARRPSGRDILRALGATESPSLTRLAPLTRSLPAHTQAQRFVGREAELELLGDAFDETRTRHRQVTVYVHGESGIGKSALVRRFTERAASEQGVVVLSGRCYEREAVPYKALDGVIDALAHYMQRLPAHEAAILMPQRASLLLEAFPAFKRVEVLLDAPRHNVIDPHELKTRAVGALRELFVRLTERRNVIVAIDDLQWADPDGLAVLGELVRPPQAPPFLLLASWRAAEESATGVKRRLDQLPGEVRHLPLCRLAEKAARDLARQLLEQAADTGTADLANADVIAREAKGHPLFIDELVRHSVLVRARPGRNLADERIDLGDVLWARIQRLDPVPRRVLDLVAVAGAPVDQEALARAAGMDLAGFGRQTALLRAVNLVRSTGSRASDLVETYHDRVRAAVLAHLEPGERQACHRDLARALDASGHADPDALVEHYRRGGQPGKARAHAARAAQAAMRALAFEQAARLYQLALDLEPESGMESTSSWVGPMTPYDLRVALGHALASAGRGLEAARVYLTAAPDADADQALDLKCRAARQLLTTGHIDEGIATLRSAIAHEGLALPGTPARAVASILWNRARLRLRGLGFVERDESAVPAPELRRLDATLNLGMSLAIADHVRGHAMGTRALRLALRAGEPARLTRALVADGAALAGMGGRQVEHAQARFDAADTLAMKSGQPLLYAWVAGGRGQAAFLAGRFRDALALCDRAESDLRERCAGVSWELASVRLWATRALLHMGAYAHLGQRLPAILEECARRNDLYGATSLRVSVAPFLQLAGDDVVAARAQVSDAISKWSPTGFHVQHYYALFAQVSASLYAKQAAVAYANVRQSWPQLARAQLLRVQFVRIAMLELRARTALAAAVVAGDPRYLAEARRDAGRIARERMPWSAGLVELIHAGIAAARGDAAATRAHLEAAIVQLDAADMALHAAVARRRLGQLQGGDQGQQQLGAAEAWMAQQGIKNPGRMSALLTPGFVDARTGG